MKERKKLLIKVLVIVSILVLLVALIGTVNYFLQETKELETQIDNFKEVNNDLKNDNSGLVSLNQSLMEENQIMQKTIDTLEEKIITPSGGFSETIALGLKEKGYPGTIDDIIEDLLEHQELIPYEGSLGGTMGFYDSSNIEILTDRWALAYFEDGHSFGFMLLEYEYSDEELIWRVIDAYMFGE